MSNLQVLTLHRKCILGETNNTCQRKRGVPRNAVWMPLRVTEKVLLYLWYSGWKVYVCVIETQLQLFLYAKEHIWLEGTSVTN